jgi:hypothetical protein
VPPVPPHVRRSPSSAALPDPALSEQVSQLNAEQQRLVGKVDELALAVGEIRAGMKLLLAAHAQAAGGLEASSSS